MKKLIQFYLTITFLSSTIYAQDKFGHIHSEQLLMIMPETADADKEFKNTANARNSTSSNV